MAVLLAITMALNFRAPWSQPATTTGVVYGTLENAGPADDELLSATSPQAVRVEFHRTAQSHVRGTAGAGAMDGMTMGSMVTMEPAGKIRIPAHGAVRFSPGALHMMLIGLRRPLSPGDRVTLECYFRFAKPLRSTFRVRSFAQGPP